MTDSIKQYIKEIKSYNVDDASEHTYRPHLQTLINAIQFPKENITPIHEGKDKTVEIEGTPDFFIYKDYTTLFKSLVGFIECKKITRNLDDVIESEQIKRYSKTTENIIITNYREFILLQKGKIKA